MPRLRTNSNILLACLAVTDALTGLFGQPLFVLWKIFQIFGLSDSRTVEICYATAVIVIVISSDVGYSRKTPCDQIYDAIPKHCK